MFSDVHVNHHTGPSDVLCMGRYIYMYDIMHDLCVLKPL